MMSDTDIPKLGNSPEDQLKVVDGGFISWVFGSSPERAYLWKSTGWTNFSARRNRIIVMDSPHLFRRDFFPGYKGHRQEKADRDEYWAAKVDGVSEFRASLRSDNRITTLELDGFEADDLITVFALEFWKYFDETKLEVVAADKDLLQVSDFLELEGFGATAEKDISFDAFRAKQAVAIQPYLTHHSQILLVLALLGDKSDDIPRLVPPRRLDQMVEILRSEHPWDLACKLYGNEPVLSNLYLTVLPGPQVFEPVLSPEQVLEKVRDNRYFFQTIKPEIVSLFNEFIRARMY